MFARAQKVVFFVFFLLVFCSCSKGQENEAVNGLSDTEKEVLIFDKVKPFPNGTEVSLAYINGGQVSFFGVKRLNDTIVFSENQKSIFEIGSITKAFTATLLASAVLSNEVSLEDSIQIFFDFKLKEGGNITLEQLSNHTSGLPRLPTNFGVFVNPNNPYKAYDSVKLKHYLKDELKLKQTPGIHYDYSNLGAGLLGYILGKHSNSTYEDLLQRRIFDRYGMNYSTSIRDSIKQDLIKGIDATGNTASNWDFNVLVGCGGILSNVEDLSKFALSQFNENNEVLQLTRKPTFSVNDNMEIGLGWHLLKTKSGDAWVWHNGGTGGYTSSMAFDMQKRNGVIVLSNVSAFNKQMGNIDALCFGLMKQLED